jgi:hypothetical protein
MAFEDFIATYRESFLSGPVIVGAHSPRGRDNHRFGVEKKFSGKWEKYDNLLDA